jgi:hypothetical protein
VFVFHFKTLCTGKLDTVVALNVLRETFAEKLTNHKLDVPVNFDWLGALVASLPVVFTYAITANPAANSELIDICISTAELEQILTRRAYTPNNSAIDTDFS